MTETGRITSIYLSGQFARFILVGGTAALLHWLSRIAINQFTTFGWAVVLAYPVGIIVAFVLNKLFVFPGSRRSRKFEVSFFFLVNILAFPLVWAIAYILGENILASLMPLQLALAIGHGVGVAAPVLVSFLLHKFITFREN
jgi:putative flippase GtrA